MRSSRATLGWSWEERRWSELGSPQREADGGGSALARRRSAGCRAGRPGRRASVEVWEGGGVAGLGNVGLGRPVRDELSSPVPMAAVDGVWAPEMA